jgi:hypothetical protein
MAKASPALNAFNAGEWSPLLDGRQDLSKYPIALKRMRNFFPKIQGPAMRRPGTRFVEQVKDSSKTVRLLPFEFSVEQAYIIEAGEGYFRFYRNNGRIEEEGVPVEEAGTPYGEEHLPGLRFVQSADVLYLFHPDVAPQKLSRTSHVNWSLDALEPQDGPYLPTNTTDTTITPSASSGTITLIASATTGINDGTGFQSNDLGRLIRIKSGSEWGWALINGYTSETQVSALVKSDLSDTTATSEWRLGLWSEITGYPTVGTFYEDRLAMGGVRDYPQRLDLSRTGDYENFAPTDPDGTVVSDHALAFTLNANNVNAIRWLLDDEKALMIGTVGGEWPLRPSNLNEAMDAANPPQAKRSTGYGSADVAPVKAGNGILFVQRAGRKVMEQAYAFEDDGFRSGDLTELAEHITAGGIAELAYQKEPDSIVWALRSDGALLGMTYRREQEVVGWHQHVIGGQSDANGTPAKVESIAVIPAADGSRDELWMIVRRSIGDQTKRYIEYMETPLPDDSAQANAFYVDCGLTGEFETPENEINELDHLNGETVQILADGASHPDRVVVAGKVTLDRAASVVQAGLPYDHLSLLETLNLEAAAADGTAQGKTKRITNCTIRFYRSLGAKTGPDTDRLDPIPELMFRDASTPMGEPTPLFTGDSFVAWPGGYETEGRVVIVPVGPFPCTVTAIFPQLVTQDR